MALKNNTWKVNQWYDQAVAGNISYSGTKQLWVWGNNGNGALGLNDAIQYSSPIQIPGSWSSSIAVGDYGASGIKSNNELFSWGKNEYGQLGQNNRTKYSSPIQIPGSWSHVDRTEYATIAIKTDGTLWCWGRGDSFGTLGQNNGTSYSSPVQIYGGGTTWRHTACGELTTLATKTDGTLWGWGWNYQGNLGINENAETSRSSPIQVGTETTWGGAGKAHQIYETYLNIKTDGTLWGMGTNGNGELGLNSTIKYSSPVQVGSDTTWSGINGLNHDAFIATKTDGTLWTWGGNNQGQLGQNNRTKYSSPVQIPGTSWTLSGEQIGGGDQNFGAIRTDGTLWTWGNNEFGSLGHNQNDVHYSSPVQVPGTDWYRITGAPGVELPTLMALKQF